MQKYIGNDVYICFQPCSITTKERPRRVFRDNTGSGAAVPEVQEGESWTYDTGGAGVAKALPPSGNPVSTW